MPKNSTLFEKDYLFGEFGRAGPSFAKKVDFIASALYRYFFRCSIQGWENVPETKAIYIGNHNGLLSFEVLMLFYAWWNRYGLTHRVFGLAHSVALKTPIFRWAALGLGVIPAESDWGKEALKRDYSLLIYPGGLKEAFRPYSERKKVNFFQRKGFIRLALEAQVPIVPLVSVGAQESYIILNRGELVARLLHVNKWLRLPGVPITFCFLIFVLGLIAWGFGKFPGYGLPLLVLAYLLPLPAKMQFVFLPPIDILKMVNPTLSEEDNLQFIYDHIVTTLQKALTEEYAKRKFQILG